MNPTHALAIVLLTAAAVAQSPLTTVFNGLSSIPPGGAIYFELECTAPAGITVSRFDLNFADAPGTQGSIAVYVKCEGFAPHTSINWIAVDTATVIAAGPDLPTQCVLAQGVPLSAGPATGFAIVANSLSHAYTPAAFAPLAYSNAELTLGTGLASPLAFAGTSDGPIAVNASAHYTIGGVGVPLACANQFGVGCGGMSLLPVVRPVLGTPPFTFRVTTAGVPQSTGFSVHTAVVGLARENTPLDNLGMTGCSWRARADVAYTVPLIGPPPSFTWFPFGLGAFPSQPSLVGVRFYVQSAVFGTTANNAFGIGAVTSNGVEFTLGIL